MNAPAAFRTTQLQLAVIIIATALMLTLLTRASYAGPTERLSEERLTALESRLKGILSTRGISRSASGVMFKDVTTDQVLFEYNADEPLIPASVMKLYTTGAALHHLKPEYTFVTSVFADSRPDEQGTIHGNLYVRGSGDPWMVPEQMYLLCRSVVASGVEAFTGKVVVDLSKFGELERPADWPKGQFHRAYAGPISPLTYFFNTIITEVETPFGPGRPQVRLNPHPSNFVLKNSLQRTTKGSSVVHIDIQSKGDKEIVEVSGRVRPGYDWTGPRSINEPHLYFANAFVDELERHGVAVRREFVVGEVPEDARVLVQHDSQPLASIVRLVNMHSNNVMAESILRTVGAEYRNEPGTTEGGVEAVFQFLHDLGVDSSGTVMTDGSGLSKTNRITAATTTHMLDKVYDRFDIAAEFIGSLAVSGAEGTMKRRLEDGGNYRMVRAKTGTVNGVTSLAGYLETDSGRRIAYTILLNELKTSWHEGRRVIDSMLEEVDEL